MATRMMESSSSVQAAAKPASGPNARRAKLVTPLASGMAAEASEYDNAVVMKTTPTTRIRRGAAPRA